MISVFGTKFKPGPRTLSVAVATLLVGVSAIAIGTRPETPRDISFSATVKAPIVQIVSPFDGRLDSPPPAHGTAVNPGDMLVRVSANAPHAPQLDSIEARLDATQRELAQTDKQIASLTEFRARLRTRMERYRKGTIARLSAQLAEAKAQHNIFKARLAQSGDALDRQQRLKTKGYASQANFDAATASAIVAENDVLASAARIRRIEVELKTARSGIFVNDNRDDVPYSQQRDDEVRLRLVDLTATAETLKSASADLQDRIARERKRVASATVFQRDAQTQGIVWESTVRSGNAVRAGQPLLKLIDCSRPYLEATLDKAAAATMTSGTEATVRLRGKTERTVIATVREVRHGSVGNGSTATVVLDLPASPATDKNPAKCTVGQVADVAFIPSLEAESEIRAASGRRTKATPVAVHYPVSHSGGTARN
ncbi:MAG: HlyD family efflux transporter periplasmic adaptor subunit [Pseudomonadota bacterium]